MRKHMVAGPRIACGCETEDCATGWPRKRGLDWQPGKLATELRMREHTTAGSRIARGCECEDCSTDSLELHTPELFCLVHSPRPAVVARTQAGGPPFSTWAGEDAPTPRREFGRARGRTDVDGWGEHALRREAAKAATEGGSSFAQQLKSGRRHFSEFSASP